MFAVERSKKLGGSRRGAVTVEAALVTPMLVTMLFGIIEFGFIFKDLLMLHQAAREGVRVAAIGATTTEINNRVQESVGDLSLTQDEIVAEFRTYNSGWSDWGTLGDFEGENDAPQNAQIRVTINYDHALVCGSFFGRFTGDPGATSLPLTSSMVMSRE